MFARLIEWWRNRTRSRAITPKRAVGDAGERAAETFLTKAGYLVQARNWRAGRDELDLVALGPREPDGSRPLVFIEVKTRSDRDLRGGYHAVDRRKRAALGRAVRAYLRAIRQPAVAWRFDIVEVRVDDTGKMAVIHHCAVPLKPK